jgi:hypothetical protein
MAINNNTAWEVRPTTGNDTNGGGFVAGSTGTDWTQQAAPKYSVTDAVANGSGTITSATANFGADIVGNVVYLQGGTGSLAATWADVTARASATSITVNATIASGTGITLHAGGALKTLAQASLIYTTSNKVFFKAEATQQISAGITFANGPGPSGTTPPQRIIGYSATRGDGGQATIQLITNTGLTAITITAVTYFENFIIDCNGLAGSQGIFVNVALSEVLNCKIMNYRSRGILVSGQGSRLISCEVTGGISGAFDAVNYNAPAVDVIWCWIHDNACKGVNMQNGDGGSVIRCLITNNTVAGSNGIITGNNPTITHCTIYGSGGDAIGGVMSNAVIRGNILAGSGGYGINGSATWAARAPFDGNAFWSNALGSRNNIDDTATNPIDGVAPYTNVNDVLIPGTNPTNDPFISKATNDFRVNNIAGAGQLLRGTLAATYVPGAGLASYEDFGCYQHQETAVAAGGVNRSILPAGVSALG